MLERIYRLSPQTRLEQIGSKRVLICTHPLQYVELNEAAWALLSALGAGRPLHDWVRPISKPILEFLEDKVGSGALECDYRVTPPTSHPPVEVIVPAYRDSAGLARCLAGLARQDYPAQCVWVTIVDDGTPTPLEARCEGLAPGRVRWLRLEQNQGPADARNAALRTAPPAGNPGPPLCAFIDSDCAPPSDWLSTLVSVLEDPHLDAAGGQVVGLHRAGWLARYEHACSSLNRGSQGGPAGGAAHRVAYLPTCNLMVRRRALEAVGGFRDGLRLGEDVDLNWRLQAAGFRSFYYPPARVAHAHRTRPWAFCQRRRLYARSEAWLRARYPTRFQHGLRPLRWALGLGMLGCLHSIALGGLLVAGAAGAEALWHRWRFGTGAGHFTRRERLLAGLRRAGAGLAQESRVLVRAGLVLALPVVALVPDLAPGAGAIVLVGAWAERAARRIPLPWIEFLPGHLLDTLAYSVGRVEGALWALLGRTERTVTRA